MNTFKKQDYKISWASLVYIVALPLLSGCAVNQSEVSIAKAVVPNSQDQVEVQKAIQLEKIKIPEQADAIRKELVAQSQLRVISDIAIDEGNNLISINEGKPINILGTRIDKSKGKIVGDIGDNLGKVYASALSKDKRYLAIGGYIEDFSGATEQEAKWIRIYRYPSGKLRGVLRLHTGAILSLAFSSDNRYLISASVDKTIRLWDTKYWQIEGVIHYPSDDVYALLMLKNKRQNSYDIYSATSENEVSLARFRP